MSRSKIPGQSKLSQPSTVNSTRPAVAVQSPASKKSRSKPQADLNCDKCGKTISGKYGSSNILAHQQRHIMVGNKFACKSCNLCFLSSQKLKEHGLQHLSDNGKLKCLLCGQFKANKHDLISHKHKVHSGKAKQYRASYLREKLNRKDLICEVCGKNLHLKISFDLHMLRHQTYCDMCKLQTNSLEELRIHVNEAHSTLPSDLVCHICLGNPRHTHGYKCIYCGNALKNEQTLSNHLMKSCNLNPERTAALQFIKDSNNLPNFEIDKELISIFKKPAEIQGKTIFHIQGTRTVDMGTGPLSKKDLEFFSLSNQFSSRSYSNSFDDLRSDINKYLRGDHSNVWNEIQRAHGYSKVFGTGDSDKELCHQSKFMNKTHGVFESFGYNLGIKGGFSNIVIREGNILRSQIPDKYLANNFPQAKLEFVDRKSGQKHLLASAFFLKIDALDVEGKNHSYTFIGSNFIDEENLNDRRIWTGVREFIFKEQDLLTLFVAARNNLMNPRIIEEWIGAKIRIRDDITVCENEYQGIKGGENDIKFYDPQPGKCPY